jgi:uncharacterized membrane protein
MEPEQKNRIVKIISQVVLAIIGISLVYAWGLNREHTSFANVGFCASMILILAVYFLVNRKYR